jgi:hypothetical protein
MKCKKCNTEEWYVKGKYRRCIECNRQAVSRYYQNKKIGVERSRKINKSKSVSQVIARITTDGLKNRTKTVCVRGHELTMDSVRIEVDRNGVQHRRCRACENLKNYKKYEIPVPSAMKELLNKELNPWDFL